MQHFLFDGSALVGLVGSAYLVRFAFQSKLYFQAGEQYGKRFWEESSRRVQPMWDTGFSGRIKWRCRREGVQGNGNPNQYIDENVESPGGEKGKAEFSREGEQQGAPKKGAISIV